jgi:hypothetical protein
MARVHVSPTEISIFIEFDFGVIRKTNLNCFLGLGKQASLLLEAVATFTAGKRPYTQRAAFTAFRNLGEFIKSENIQSLPKSLETWQRFISSFYEFHFSRDDRIVRFETRQRAWNSIVLICEYLRDYATIISVGVEIPKLPTRVLTAARRANSDLLGDSDLEPAEKTSKDDLLGIPLHLPDETYLDFVRDSLIEKRRVIHDCLIAWWEQIRAHEAYGETLLKNVDWPALSALLKLQNYRYSAGPGSGTGHGKYHLANGRTQETLRNLLAILKYEFDGRSTKPIFQSAKHLPSLSIVQLPPECPKAVSFKVTNIQRINWMLGHLAPIDIAVLAALLIMHNPSFTPMSLLGAKAYTKGQKTIFEIGVFGHQFTVEKPRAKAMKKSKLDELSIGIFSFIYRITEVHRNRLLENNSPAANYLFLSTNKSYDNIPVLEGVVGYLSGAINLKRKSTGVSLLDHFPDLKKAGLTKGTITFKGLRTTEGVLEWFRTGSTSAMAKRMGNSTSVTINHYLPKSLLDLWNTRMIRRFQNLWLVIASPNKETMIASTDFQTADELQTFIEDMLVQHPNSSSPLAEKLRESIAKGDTTSKTSTQSNLDGSLSISISRSSLTALYLYHDAAHQAGIAHSRLQEPGPNCEITPQAILDLSELLRHQLPSSREKTSRITHLQAEDDLKKLKTTIKWADLFVKKTELINAKFRL